MASDTPGRQVRVGALFAVFVLFNLLITIGAVISQDKAAAQMNGALAIGNIAIAPLFYRAIRQQRAVVVRG